MIQGQSCDNNNVGVDVLRDLDMGFIYDDRTLLVHKTVYISPDAK